MREVAGSTPGLDFYIYVHIDVIGNCQTARLTLFDK
jgi:hypothetical protein